MKILYQCAKTIYCRICFSIILSTSLSSSPPSSTYAPKYLYSFTLLSNTPCSFTLLVPSCSPFHRLSICSVFSLFTLSPLSSSAILTCSNILSTSCTSSAISTISSANSIHHGTSCTTPFSSSSNTRMNKYGLKADPWCTPTFTSKLSDTPVLVLILVVTLSYISFTIFIYVPPTPLFLNTSHSTLLGTRSYAFSKSTNTTCIFFFLLRNFFIICLSIKIGSLVDLPGMNPNCLPLISVFLLNLLSTTLSHTSNVWFISFIPL